jgi:alpha-mannosidase
MEKPEGPELKIVDDTVTVPIHPFEILTMRVDFPAQR